MNDKILTIYLPPIIQSLSDYADMFTVMPSSSYYMEWLCEHYTNLVYLYTKENGHEFNFFSPIYTNCEIMDYDVHVNNIILTSSDINMNNVVDYIKELIEQGFYVIIETNQYFVPETSFYNIYNYVHRQLYYGFSDNNHCFYTLGYHADRKYNPSIIPYESIPRAVIEYEKQLAAPIHTIRTNHEHYKFDKHKSAKEYWCYLNSKYDGELTRNDYFFGIEAMEKFHCIIDATIKGEMLNEIPISLFYEQKKLQKVKIEQYIKWVIPNINEEMLKQASEISYKAYHILLLYMKYHANRDISSLEKIHGYIDDIIDKEKILYTKLFSILNE